MSVIKCSILGPVSRGQKLELFKSLACAENDSGVQVSATVNGKEFALIALPDAPISEIDIAVVVCHATSESVQYFQRYHEEATTIRIELNVYAIPLILLVITSEYALQRLFCERRSQFASVSASLNAIAYMECSIGNQNGMKALVDTAIRAATSPSFARRIHQNTCNLNNWGLTSVCLPHENEFLLSKAQQKEAKNSEVIYLGENSLSELSAHNLKVVTLHLYNNKFVQFPDLSLENLKYLDLSNNELIKIPSEALPKLPSLIWLNVDNNKLEDLPSNLVRLETLKIAGNPLSKILPAYRNDMPKLMFYLRMVEQQPTQPWNHIKLMLVGYQGVGKTTLVRKLQNSKYKCDSNISTDGVSISKITLPRNSSTLFSKQENVQFNVWDFGGQAVFHSTHRLFITSQALYLVLYKMDDPSSIDRIKYWIEQIGAIPDSGLRSKPILVVGTHADKIANKQERAEIEQRVATLYPMGTRTQVYGHYTLSTVKDDIADIRSKIVQIALNHPNIGIGKVTVPRSFMMLQEELQERKNRQYMKWDEYITLCNSIGIEGDDVRLITTTLHDTGLIVWHDIHKLRDVVVIDPQWFADALSGVVTFMQEGVFKDRGMSNWARIREAFRLKFQDTEMHETVLSLLQFFEIVYKMQMDKQTIETKLNPEQMFFVPSLLVPVFDMHTLASPPLSSVPRTLTDIEHLSIQYWNSITTMCQDHRKFSWSFYPTGFFPCLLMRLAHLRIRVLAGWLDAAVILGGNGAECALLQLHSFKGKYELQIRVKGNTSANNEPLIANLAYVIAKLHRDMYSESGATEVPIVHHIVASVNNSRNRIIEKVIPYEGCIKEQIQGRAYLDVDGVNIRIDQLTRDMSGCLLIPRHAVQVGALLGAGNFGKVHKAEWTYNATVLDVAIKELIVRMPQDENTLEAYHEHSHVLAIYDFQHELTIMSKLNHTNIVKLHGVVQSPLQMVMEYVPNSDLQHLLAAPKSLDLSLKWRLKLAIDCASGMRYLHSQHPPICHSDLRAPNIFIASMDEKDLVIGKIADFGLSQQIFPLGKRKLKNIDETAPETWTDSNFYDHKADVFSFAVILWRLFGAKRWYEDHSTSEDDSEFITERGYRMNDVSLMAAIRAGSRLTIHPQCPSALTHLIKQCWELHAEARPSFKQILKSLVSLYVQQFSEDSFILQRDNGASAELSVDLMYLQEFTKTSFAARAWIPFDFGEETTVTSLVETGTDIWIGLDNYWVYVIDAKSQQVLQKCGPHTKQSNLGTSIRGIPLLSVDCDCVWVAEGNVIRVFSTKTRQEITACLQNNHAITCMVYISRQQLAWVADVDSNISIWDTRTFQKYNRFQIHISNCAQRMASMFNFVWMAVGRDLVAVHTKSLRRIEFKSAHSDRIYNIVAVPLTNKVWTFGRNCTVRVWRMQSDDTKAYEIKLVHEITMSSPPKSACMMADGVHVCAGAFDGSVFMWDTEGFHQTEIPRPSSNKSIQCLLDTENFLWCGMELANEALICHPHSEPKAKYARRNCPTHRSSHHDFCISNRASSEGLDSTLQALYEALSKQMKKSNEPVLVYWDVRCSRLGQYWEREFVQGLIYSRAVILIVSDKGLSEINENAAQRQNNILAEYECALLQNKLKDTPVVPLYIADEETDTISEATSFFPLEISKHMNPADYPAQSHARGHTLQIIINDLRNSLPPQETAFLDSVSGTIEQLGKLHGAWLNKRGTDATELNTFVTRMMEELQ